MTSGSRVPRPDTLCRRVPEECPQEIADLIDSCLLTDPKLRPTAQEALDVLAKVGAA